MRILSTALLIILASVSLHSMQTEDSHKADFRRENDTLNFLIERNDTIAWIADTLNTIPEETVKTTKIKVDDFKPNPTKAVIYSAIFPGLGQIYNRKYWKLPIIYGGFLGLTYAISWNGRYYNDYSDAYKAIMSDDPRSPENSAIWLAFLTDKNPLNYDDARIEQLRSAFKRSKDTYRRNRDLSIIGTVALYALCMIDAYVDAQLFDFDISPDLSFRVEPTVINPLQSNRALGVQCSFKF